MNASSVTPNTAGIESSAKQVGGRDRDEDDEQRRGHRAPAHPGEHPSAGVVVGEGQHPARRTDDRVVLDVGVPVAMAKELDRGREEQRAEDREHEREARDEDGPERDEDRPHDQGDEDAEGQDALLVPGRHREGGQDHDEHEEVVDGEALLDEVAGEVLRAEVPAGD
jgi:hypothetical protein